MDNLKIILFICNWGPHAAFQTLQDNCAAIPPEVRMVRIPCTGRISKSLLFKAFEMGADGVALVGCEAGSCRYGSGTLTAERNVEDIRGIIELLGLGKERLRLAMFLPEQTEALLNFLQGFHKDIQTMGKSPVSQRTEDRGRKTEDRGQKTEDRGQRTEDRGQEYPSSVIRHPSSVIRPQISNLLSSYDIFACQDCGKCSSACPLTLSGKPFSPRAMANAIIAGDMESSAVTEDVWSCLTCGLCYDRCPSAVDFPEFIRDMRHVSRSLGSTGPKAHGGFFQSLMRTMTSPDLKTKHWKDLPEDIRTDPEGKILFFGGCAPYFDTYFKNHLGVQTNNILVDGLRLLNFFDIHPRLLDDERCCGHDLLWSGDKENFLELARLNVEAIEKAGIEEVVTACPECYRTLARDYPEQGVEVKFKVTHLFDLVEKEIDKGAIGFDKLDRKLTFQDPCRLSRLENRADLPRKLLGRLKPQQFEEMKDRGVSALCCGNCAWMGCDSYSKALQVKRLRQARDTGSDLLVTACPKCQIHLRCAMEDPFLGDEIRMEMMDLTSVLAKTIRWE